MRICPRWLELVCSILALGACQNRGSSDQDSRPLPSPEPPSSAVAAPREQAVPAKKRALDDASRAGAPKPAGEEPAKPNASPTGGAATAAGSPSSAASAAEPPAVASAAPIAPSATCLTRCQGALQGCLAQPVDGGVPGFANLDLCKKAFEACQAACTP